MKELFVPRGLITVLCPSSATRLVKIAERLLWTSTGLRKSRLRGAFAVAQVAEDVGDRPAIRVLNRARLHAEDLRVGGRRARRKYDELFVETLDSLEDQYDLLADVEAKQMVDVLVALFESRPG